MILANVEVCVRVWGTVAGLKYHSGGGECHQEADGGSDKQGRQDILQGNVHERIRQRPEWQARAFRDRLDRSSYLPRPG